MKADGAQGALFTDTSASGVHLTDAQRLDWLRLIRSDNIGPRTFRGLINRYGGAAAALEALPGLIAKTPGARKIRIAPRDACERELALAARMGARFIALGEPDYPPALRAIDAPPPLIAAMGRLECLQQPMIAIVGSRNASSAGLTLAGQLAHGFAAEGYAVVSGLARGIDQQAHKASMQTGTIAVLAGGLDKIYPAEHRGLAEEICARGALLSEMPFGWEPRGRDFPRRNRIVSGIALATVVVEAARRSGSLITARFANEQGREVFAVPGSPLDPRAEGTNDLLRQGATMCTRAEDVTNALAPLREAPSHWPQGAQEAEPGGPDAEPLWDESDLFGAGDPPATLAGMELDEESAPPPSPSQPRAHQALPDDPLKRVEAALSPSPVGIDDLLRTAEVTVAQGQAALLDLELQGRLERHGGGLVSLRNRHS